MRSTSAPDLLVEHARRRGLDLLGHQVAEAVVVEIEPVEPEHDEALRQQSGGPEVVERRDQLALGQVAAGAEDDHHVRRRRRVAAVSVKPVWFSDMVCGSGEGQASGFS
jgi:hypothetical protein